MPEYPAHVKLVEVGPRDGLQNEGRPIPTATKIEFIDHLSASGLTAIEATSFVRPGAIAQLADAAEVCRGIQRHPGVVYPVLVPNERGFEHAIAAGARAIAVFTAASETFNRHNINCSIAESFARFEPVLARARRQGLWIRGYVSTVIGCPYEGPVSPARVAAVAADLDALGVNELSLGDTIGVGTPRQVRTLLEAVTARVSAAKLAVHFHDTYGQAIANICVALELGITIVDASVAGLGGCPYAEGATGNVATEDVLYLLQGLGIETGVDMDRLIEAGRFITHALGRNPASRLERISRRRRFAFAPPQAD